MQMKTWLGTTALLLALAGCSGGKSGALARGYLATDSCSQHVTAADCGTSCRWVDIAVDNGCGTGGKLCASPVEGSAGTGACVAEDPCLALGKDACASDPTCAWSAAETLCPIGAACDDGGYCHARNQGGTDCACVSPVSSNADGTLAPVECDCSGGGASAGSGSGGACACACPACAPGETCPPCDCQCNDGGPTCTSGTTCACACLACAPGETCPPCDCNCGAGGGTTAGGSATGTGTGTATGSSGSGGKTGSGTNAIDAGSACTPPSTPSNPPTGVCPGLGCDPACPKGTTTDANGCPTCTCA